MKERLVRCLACPSCKGGLRLEATATEKGDVLQGGLRCGCGATYPIRDGIPRFVPAPPGGAPSDGQGQVAQSFGSKWTRQPGWGLDGATERFFRQWMLEKYGWGSEQRFRERMARCSLVLDAGTGLGREVRNMAAANPAADVLGLELSDAVDVARRAIANLPRAHLVQGDILAPPLRPAAFDFILSEGVLHHTPDTRQALTALVDLLRPGGEIAFYVYRTKGPLRELADDLIREHVSRLTPDEAWHAVQPLTQLGQALQALKAEAEILQDIPVLGIPAGRYDVQRLFYDHVVKCFWNPTFSFDENNLVNFDWYHPAYAHRHSPEEVRGWVNELGLQLVHFKEEPSGITVRACRPQGERS